MEYNNSGHPEKCPQELFELLSQSVPSSVIDSWNMSSIVKNPDENDFIHWSIIAKLDRYSYLIQLFLIEDKSKGWFSVAPLTPMSDSYVGAVNSDRLGFWVNQFLHPECVSWAKVHIKEESIA